MSALAAELDPALGSINTMFDNVAVRMGVWLKTLTYFDHISNPFLMFYDGCFQLSNPAMGPMGGQYDVLFAHYTDSDDHVQEFNNQMVRMLGEWRGDAASAANGWVGQYVEFVNSCRDGVAPIYQAILAYGAVIDRARNNQLEMMTSFVNLLDQQQTFSGEDAVGVAWTGLGAFAGAILGAASLSATFAATLASVVTEYGKANTQAEIKGGSWQEIADSYLGNQARLLIETRDTINNVVIPRLDDALRAFKPMSPVPSQFTEFDKDHGVFEPKP